jgi:ATP-dependent Clp protease ATP-binding subunit ClpC
VVSHDDHPDILALEGRELTADPGATGDKTFGRKLEVEALARTLAAGRSAVLVGPPGVGKTAILHKLLHYLRARRLPGLEDVRIFEISTVGLCSDTRYTGMQESKIQGLLAHATPRRWVYVPDVWNLPTAGSYDTNPRGIYDLMRPGVEAGKLVLFGESTEKRWEALCRRFPALGRDFAVIRVAETSEEETREILLRTAADVGHLATFEKAALDRIQVLARKFLPTLSFPGKAVELVRRVAHLARPPSGPPREGPVDAAFVEDAFARDSGLPLHMISPRVRVSYDDIHRFLSERVLGQPEAVQAVADVLALYKTGLKNPDRPAGVLLFVGPTGVGKTELAKATCEFLFGAPSRMFRADLSEYKDYYAFEKLIGEARSGKTGLLTDHVRRSPFTVVLLDEFEKGHPNLADLFLQVFDDGRLTDASGETIDFRHALLILTSNVGSELADVAGAIGFGEGARESPRAMAGRVVRALESSYRPEFLNRIDRVLVFRPLGREDLRRIAQRELGKLYRREGLLERDLLLEIDEGVIDLLLERGIDPKYGARPLKRAIEETLVMPLARALLDATERRFQLLRIARKGDGVALSFEETESSRKLANLERRTRVDDGEGKVVRLSVAEVAAALKEAYQRLERLGQAADIAGLRAQLAELEVKESRPGFWEAAFGKSGELVRRHQLAVEVQRFDDLTQRCDLLREMVEASFAEAEDALARDLVGAWVRLDRALGRAERELVHFDAVDRGDARLEVRPVGGKDGGAAWAAQLAQMYAAWASEHDYEVRRAGGPAGLLLEVAGPYAYGYLKGEQGGHRLIAAPEGRDGERGETYLARVEVTPLSGGARAAPRGTDDEPPIRTYDQWRSRGVRDRRTGWVEGDVRRVLGGRLGPFLEAWLTRPAAEA